VSSSPRRSPEQQCSREYTGYAIVLPNEIQIVRVASTNKILLQVNASGVSVLSLLSQFHLFSSAS
jgi:hypothetical protein